MVVDGDGRPVFVVAEDAMHDRIALFGPINLSFTAVTFDSVDGELDALCDVFGMGWIDGDGGSFYKLAQQFFKLRPVRFCKRQKVIPF